VGTLLMANLSNDKRVIVLSPHPDDEIIGCWSLLYSLQNKSTDPKPEVWYIFGRGSPQYELRQREAEVAGTTRGWDPIFVNGIAGLSDRLSSLAKGTYDLEFYVPSIADSHPQHKEVNRSFRNSGVRSNLNATVKFYSVDLDQAGKTKSALSAWHSAEKKTWLDESYPSQRSLWDVNASYYLFERISDSDFAVSHEEAVRCGVEDLTVRHNGLAVPKPEYKTPEDLIDSMIANSGATAFSFYHNRKFYEVRE
jgi:hypothetical protein